MARDGISIYIDEGAIQNIVISLTLALHYCHTPTSARGAILHRDIKPENGTSASIHDRTERCLA
jgi:serine/threonine protein kinase